MFCRGGEIIKCVVIGKVCGRDDKCSAIHVITGEFCTHLRQRATIFIP